MPKGEIDDQLTFNRKILAAGNEATGAWVRLISLANDQLTDGFLTTKQVSAVAPPRVISRMVDAGLARRVTDPEPGVVIHDFLKHNRSREDVLAQREAEKKRKADYRAKSGRPGPTVVPAGHPPVSPQVSGHPLPLPSPSPITAPTTARAASPETGAVVRVLTASIATLGIDAREVPAWAATLVDSLDLPRAASPVPYVRTALAKLGDLVTATPATPTKDRLAYVRRTTVGLVNQDKANGWSSGKTDGRDGVCAPPKGGGVGRSNGQAHPTETDHDHELEMMRTANHGVGR